MTATINDIKGKFEDLVGEDKTKTHAGVLTETYPAVFVVELNNGDEDLYERVSFNYADVLTESIEIEFPNADVELLPVEEEDEQSQLNSIDLEQKRNLLFFFLPKSDMKKRSCLNVLTGFLITVKI